MLVRLPAGILAGMHDSIADSEPRDGGFRNRGRELTRMEAFVDAAFAFAVTLLIISVGDVPRTADDLVLAFKGVPAFAASFATMAMFWYSHSRWSRRFGLDDLPSVLLSMLLVFLVLVYVFPLRAVFGSMFSWMTQGWLPTTYAVSGRSDLRVMFVLYGICIFTMAATITLLYWRAWRLRDTLGLDAEERHATCAYLAANAFLALVAATSLIAALLLPGSGSMWVYAIPGTLYCLLAFTGVFANRMGDRWFYHSERLRQPIADVERASGSRIPS